MAQFVRIYSQLDQQDLSSLEALYHPAVVFEDSAHRVEGWPALHDYFQRLFQNVTHCEFRIHQSMADGAQGYVVWTMVFAHPKLNRGQHREVQGCSHLTFQDNQVIHHRDYFDLGEMLYEAIPLLGRVVKSIKAGL
ncbi:nuclear transport factor 2 family protein (plasmid) [Photobacterium sp. GJ3]|uniref:nuclear transport factor 2 family protein n=1 Tax=Photobacterium sp. GJ3 TaxID=2829502 RepID=UPI001B8B32BA|nr:nuclear transport factor 2 family protein [Photobacterium sp. GJ3]QUJ70579.1 nuclear transport factor 2 family protein [Photobacterium sp. GJ3]